MLHVHLEKVTQIATSEQMIGHHRPEIIKLMEKEKYKCLFGIFYDHDEAKSIIDD